MNQSFSFLRVMMSCLLFWVGGSLFAQDYPAPRYPTIPEVDSIEDLLEIARTMVAKPSRRETLRPGYDVKAGEKVLMVIPSNFPPLVRDALAIAIREAGARLDIALLDPGSGANSEADHHGLPQDGTVEASRMLEPPVPRGGEGRVKVLAIANSDQYDLVIEGTGGPQPVTPYRWERIPWDSIEKFVVSAGFPADVQTLIDKKVWDAFKSARRIRITDPEGTDLSWSVKPGHLDILLKEWDDPIYPPGTYDIVKRGHISLTPLFMAMSDIDAEGVVAGTINHAGVFPNVKLFLEGGKIVRAESGGRYGETIQAVLRKYENVQYPGFPGPGAGWFIEASLGTNPRRARVSTVTKGESMLWERGRSGVIHWGFGVSIPPTSSHREEYTEKVNAEGLTRSHLHIHTYFNTIDVQTRGGETIRVADKGHITFLDDPDVRRLAAQYGDPDQILQEAWIPAVPGINIPGDYQDYAADPGPWIKFDVDRLEEQNSR